MATVTNAQEQYECYVCGSSNHNIDMFYLDDENENAQPRYICRTFYDCSGHQFNMTATSRFPTCEMKYKNKYKCCICNVTYNASVNSSSSEYSGGGYIFMESDNIHYNAICTTCYNKALGINEWQFIGDGAVLEKVQQYQGAQG